MFEKVNPCHPDKVADRIAGAMVDYAYSVDENPKVAVEVLIGHDSCRIITETSVHFPKDIVTGIVRRICNETVVVDYTECRQDKKLASNQSGNVRCGDNGIFKGTPTTDEQKRLTQIAKAIFDEYGKDGKYILNDDKLIICQSWAKEELNEKYPQAVVNPLGYWTGGVNVDTGATNRKLGSDMGDAVTGGGLHGKDLSKADVSINVYCHLLANAENRTITMCCSIGDEYVNGMPYSMIVDIAKKYIREIGGFEKLAEWGLIRP